MWLNVFKSWGKPQVFVFGSIYQDASIFFEPFEDNVELERA